MNTGGTFVVFAFSACAAFAAATFGDTVPNMKFGNLDAALAEAARIEAGTARKEALWNDEKSRLETLEKSYRALVESRRAKIAEAERGAAAMLETCEVVVKKIQRDESSLERASAFLDLKYMQLLSDKRAVAVLESAGAPVKKFEAKTLPEKVRALAEMLARLREADEAVRRSGTSVSTGLFVRAEGGESGGIAVLKVERVKENVR